MSVTPSDFLNAWNETMPVQIRDADIKNPSEHNLRNWLITILRQFFVDTQAFENMEIESGTRLRSSRVRLVATVNHFYKIAFPGAKQDFVYFDLIKPTFKRVFNVLNCLLNYCNFVRYTYAETIQDLKIKLQERDDFRMIKHQLLTNIEKAKIKKENDIKLIRDFSSKIPRQKTINEELETKETRLRKELNKIHVECEKSDVDLIGAKNELEIMRNLIVSDQEIDNILSAREQTEKHLEEQDQFSIAVRQRLKENAHGIEKAQEITTKMESLLSSFSIDAGEMKNKNKEVEDLKTEINIFQSKISKIQLEIETLSQSIEMKNKNVTHIILKRNEIKKSYSVKEAKQNKELKEKENFLRRLVITEASLATVNQRLHDEQQLLFKVASNVIKHISIKMFDKNPQQD